MKSINYKSAIRKMPRRAKQADAEFFKNKNSIIFAELIFKECILFPINKYNNALLSPIRKICINIHNVRDPN